MLGPHVSRTLCLLVALTTAIPSLGAQDHGGMWIELIQDPAGDVRAESPTGPLPARSNAVDVRYVRIQEFAGSYIFSLESEDRGGFGSSSIRSVVAFAFQDASSGDVRQVEIRVNLDGFELVVNGVPVREGPSSFNGHPYDYEAKFGRNLLSSDAVWGVGDRIFNIYATLEDPDGEPFPTSDRGPDSGYGKEHVAEFAKGDAEHDSAHGEDAAAGMHGAVDWETVEGPDFASGPSVSVDAEDTIHLAYIVYRDDGVDKKGLYHATVKDGTFAQQRVADASMLTDLHEDGNTATAIDVDEDGTVHILYYPHPNSTQPDQIKYARSEDGVWVVEDPTRLVDGSTQKVDDGYRSIPALVARGDRVVAGFQSGTDSTVIVERSEDGTWKLVKTLAGRLPRLGIDASGDVHVAFFRSVTDGHPNRGVDGDLYYASEATGFAERKIASDLTELTRFWTGSESDGTFAFALTPKGEPTFLWETNHGDRVFGTLNGEELVESRSPLEPTHGNPQVRMRMVFDQDGNAHVASGYGGSDLYAMRTPAGAWATQDIYRHDMFSLDVLSDGRAVISHTQPHGGTTLAVLIAGRRPASEALVEHEKEDEPPAFPGTPVIPGPGIAVGITGGLGALTWMWLRGVDRAPRLLGASVAAIAGFSRLKKNEILDHESREEIVEAVLSAPGRTAADVRKALGLSRTTFFYHLRRLEQEGLIRVIRQGAQVFLHAPTFGSTMVEPATIEARIVRAANDVPGMAARDYAAMLQLHERTVRHHLLNLERRGQIRSERASARAVHWFGGAGRGQN